MGDPEHRNKGREVDTASRVGLSQLMGTRWGAGSLQRPRGVCPRSKTGVQFPGP